MEGTHADSVKTKSVVARDSNNRVLFAVSNMQYSYIDPNTGKGVTHELSEEEMMEWVRQNSTNFLNGGIKPDENTSIQSESDPE